MKKHKVIAISGASGCGKTSLVKALSAYFHCPSLHFDDHVKTHSYPKNMKMWYQNGADVSEIKTPSMVTSLHELIAVGHPYIFVEEPFGRERSGISDLIDCVILLDQPMELCLSRVIRRNIEYSSEYSHNNNSLINYLLNYEDYFRDIYIDKVNQVRENCDLLISDLFPVEDTLSQVVKWLEEQAK